MSATATPGSPTGTPAGASTGSIPTGTGRPVIDKTDDPFPPSLQFRIKRFTYADGATNPPLPSPPSTPPSNPHPETYGAHLQLVRYNARPKESDPTSDWQLRTGYTVWIDIDWMDETKQWREETWALTAPRAMYTDLSSIPAFARWIVSKSGPHLEASIIHDWLYLKWTDHRFGQNRFSDWVFADAVLAAGLRELKDFHWFKRRMVNFAVQAAGWIFFFKKDVPLSVLLPRWEKHLDTYPHNAPVPPDEQAKPVPQKLGTRFYAWGILLFSLAVALLGLARLWAALTGWFSGKVGFWDGLFTWHTHGPGAEAAAFIGQWAAFGILVVLGTLGVALVLAVGVWALGRTVVGVRRALGR